MYSLKQNYDFFVFFIKFRKLVESQFDQKIKIFQCDDRGKYNSNFFIGYITNCRIKLHISYPRTPKQNKVVERKH